MKLDAKSRAIVRKRADELFFAQCERLGPVPLPSDYRNPDPPRKRGRPRKAAVPATSNPIGWDKVEVILCD